MLLETIMTTQIGENVENDYIDESQDLDVDTSIATVNEDSSMET